MTDHTYPATVLDVHDGDTFKATIDLGIGTTAKDRDLGFHLYVENHRLVLHADVRLAGCNARELAQPGGVEARDTVRALLPVGSKVTIGSVGADKYGGRYDCTVTLPDGRDLVGTLIDGHWLAAWDGKGARPLPPWPIPA